MKIRLIAIGKLKAGPEQELVSRYLERARGGGKVLGLSEFDVREFGESRKGDVEGRKKNEAALLLGPEAKDRIYRVALDEKGRNLTSPEFAQLIGTQRDNGIGQMHFIIGGPDGLGREVRQMADLVLSFSALTWPHQLVRGLLAEQLYRATTILSNHPYHRV